MGPFHVANGRDVDPCMIVSPLDIAVLSLFKVKVEVSRRVDDDDLAIAVPRCVQCPVRGSWPGAIVRSKHSPSL